MKEYCIFRSILGGRIKIVAADSDSSSALFSLSEAETEDQETIIEILKEM